MLVVILGAGASFDSRPAEVGGRVLDEWRPPLTNSLFDPEAAWADRLTGFPQALPAIVPIRRQLGQGVGLEKILEEMLQSSGGSISRKRQLLAIQFFLRQILHECSHLWHESLGGLTSYAEMIGEVTWWSESTGTPVCYVTFNYDTLLEQAFADAHIHQFASMDTYVSSAHLKLIKPHGSIDWIRLLSDAGSYSANEAQRSSHGIDDHRGATFLIENPPPDSEYTGEFDKVKHHSGIAAVNSTVHVGAPAIALPVQYKPNSLLVLPDTHRQALEESFTAATKLLVIGWRASEIHFLDIMRTSVDPRIPVEIVSKNSGLETIDNLSNAGLGDFRNTGMGFTEYLGSGRLAKFVS